MLGVNLRIDRAQLKHLRAFDLQRRRSMTLLNTGSRSINALSLGQFKELLLCRVETSRPAG